ncbi:MAG: helix-turn-helix transcriptional regulator [Defluviicoccus sp.]
MAWPHAPSARARWADVVGGDSGAASLLDDAVRRDAHLRQGSPALIPGLVWSGGPSGSEATPNALFGVIEREGEAVFLLVLARGANEPRFVPEDVARLQSLMGVLRAWLQAQRQTRWASETAALAIFALDDLALGVVVADAEGMIRLANRRAGQILKAADGLYLAGGCIRCVNARDQARLHQALAGVPDGPPAASRTHAALRIGRERCRWPLQLVLSRVPAGADPTSGLPFHVLFLADPELQPIPPEEWLCAFYALSRVEARVTRLLAGGEKPDAIARQLGLSVYTVRGYMKDIFLKVGADRQASLMRCLLSGVAQLDGQNKPETGPIAGPAPVASSPVLSSRTRPVGAPLLVNGTAAAAAGSRFKFLHK